MTLSRFAPIGFVLLGAAGAAMAVEEPKYRIEKDYGSFEVRVYRNTGGADSGALGER